MSAVSDAGNMALRHMRDALAGAAPASRFDHGYLLGQLLIIRVYLEPDRELLAEVADAIQRMPRTTN